MGRGKRKSSKVRLGLLAGLMIVVGLALFMGHSAVIGNDKPAESVAEMRASKDKYYTVSRGSFNVNLVIEGNLDAIKHHVIKSELQGRSYGLEITKLVEDRSQVREGDLIVAFRADKYVEQEDRLVIALDDEYKNLSLAQEDLVMIKAGNLSSIKSSVDQLRDSREALEKYEEQEAPRKRKELQTAIKAAQQKVNEARDAVSKAKDELTGAYMEDQGRVDELRKKVAAAENALIQANDNLKKAHDAVRDFKQYEHLQKMRNLREGLTKRRMELQRELVSSSGNVIKAQRRIQNHQLRIRQLEKELAELRTSMQQLAITAPVDGIIKLGNPGAHQWQQQQEMKVGTQVNPQEIIASIPDLSKFKVDASIPEEYRSRLREGLEVRLRSKAVPDLVLSGKVTEIAPMARHIISWDQSSPKVYATVISTEGADRRLMPGMTMQVEIILEEVRDVLYAPVEAIYNREGKTFCRTRRLTGPEELLVVAGRTSNHYVEIIEGIAAGDTILLQRPEQK